MLCISTASFFQGRMRAGEVPQMFLLFSAQCLGNTYVRTVNEYVNHLVAQIRQNAACETKSVLNLPCDEDIKNREYWIASGSSWYTVPYWNITSAENLLSCFPMRCWVRRNKLEERNLSASAVFWILLALEGIKALYVFSARRSTYI